MTPQLNAKVGGVPAWTWLVGGVGAVGVWFVFKRKGPQSSTTPTSSSANSSVPIGQAYPSTIPVIIPSNDPFNTGLNGSISAPQSGTPVSDGPGTAVAPPAPAPAPPPAPAQTNPFLRNGGWWPAGVAGASPESELIFALYDHYLDREPSVAEISSQIPNLQRMGYGAFRQAVMNSPEARNKASQIPVQP